MPPLHKITGRLPIRSLITPSSKTSGRQLLPSVIYSRNYSDANFESSTTVKDEAQRLDYKSSDKVKPKKKTQAELDAEVMAKLAGHDSEGGEAGIEYEDGKPASMKRSVKNNMFRYI